MTVTSYLTTIAYQRQLACARRMEAAYLAYAHKIGVTCIVHDEMQVTIEQAALLGAKWKELVENTLIEYRPIS